VILCVARARRLARNKDATLGCAPEDDDRSLQPPSHAAEGNAAFPPHALVASARSAEGCAGRGLKRVTRRRLGWTE
jgi:hypothetical protein